MGELAMPNPCRPLGRRLHSAPMTTPVSAAAIRLRGVRHNNLKNLALDVPIGRLTVVTGLSGSGKSSLAFDTLFAEGQRRYIETFSPYARQFFDRMDKPQADRIEGIPPAIAIEQRNTVRTTRSTVGTLTELCDYLKLLWPHVAQLHCRQCAQPVRREPPQVVWQIMTAAAAAADAEALITFTVPLSARLSLQDSLELIAKQGYQRLVAGNEILRIADVDQHRPFRTPPSAITVVQDRLKIRDAHRARFIEACEQAYHFGKGKLTIFDLQPPGLLRQPRPFSAGYHCANCDLDYREPTSALFSFNHPSGACPACKGFGRIITIDYDRAIPDRSKTLAEGCVKPWQVGHGLESQRDLLKFCQSVGIPTNVPFAQLPRKWQDWVIEGDRDYGSDEDHQWPRAWYGVKGYFRWLESKAYKMHVRVLLSRYRAYTTCPDCQGRRFNPDSLLYQWRIADDGLPLEHSPDANSPSALTLADFYALPVEQSLRLIEQFSEKCSSPQRAPGRSALPHPPSPIEIVLSEARSRLCYLVEVGLGYLTLDRPTRTLSGGETERVNLTTCLGTRLVNTLFVLDEPSVGLHPRDTTRLIRILEHLRDAGNTVVVVEHEASVMRAADQIVDLGPGQGEKGGEIIFCGHVEQLLESGRSLTGRYLSGRSRIEIPPRRTVRTRPDASLARAATAAGVPAGSPAGALWLNEAAPPDGPRLDAGATLRITNASRHNLKNLTVDIPLGRFVCLTGVSGSGKTTLIREVLLPALEARLKPGTLLPKQPASRLPADESDADNSAELSNSSGNLAGWESLGQVILVDQAPLGKTPRSNPAVYLGAFDHIRDLFAQSDRARQRGLNASAFSFNSSVGQCERCRGAGFEKIEMQFLSDVFIRCPECNGRRYRAHILEIKLHANGAEWSIADLLETTVDEALAFLMSFIHLPAGRHALARLRLVQEVGLGYLRLGQPINTLSGGESQRLKLVSHLAEATVAAAAAAPSSSAQPSWPARSRGTSTPLGRGTEPRAMLLGQPEAPPGDRRDGRPSLFLFDEPTTGLHFDDVRVLLQVFQRLVDAGHSVLVIEHNLDVIKCADWIIDLGPEAGERGGQLVAQGTPEDVAACEHSHTGRFLRELLAGGQGREEVTKPAREKKLPDTRSFPPSPASAVPARVGRSPGMGRASGDAITVHGAREHNLKNLSLDIPRGQFVVITGVSGSGKSTLAFDLLFAEGQRRFLDSMNTYARQFVEQLSRPDVDLITGLPPTVSIEQRTTRGGGKSTVATVTEVYHFLRLLFARLGTQFCPDCQLPVEAQTRDRLAAGLRRETKKRGDLLLLAPVVRNRKGFHTDVAEWAARHGYREIRADGKMHPTSQPLRLDRFREHDVEIVVGVLDRKAFVVPPFVVPPSGGPRLIRGRPPQSSQTRPPEGGTTNRSPQELIDETLKLGQGTLFALDNHGTLTLHSTERACPKCARSFSPLDPKNFSYNSSQGWCSKCRGFGELFYLPDVDRGANSDSIEESWWSWQAGEREICPACNGTRLRPESRAVRLLGGAASGKLATAGPPKGGTTNGATIDFFSALAVAGAYDWFRKWKCKGRAAAIARDIVPEILERLKFLDEVGLGYLQLGRGVTTLSGGEAQRIRLAAQLGSNLSGVLYVLDEPTIGLHARDNEQLLAALQQLQSRGNSLVVVEHDEETMRHADYIIDLGPGAGVHGGQVVAAGTLAQLLQHPDSITGQCLRAQEAKTYPARGQRRPVRPRRAPRRSPKAREAGMGPAARRNRVGAGQAQDTLQACPMLTLQHARLNNLKNLTVRFPLQRFVVVTGVSGSGKSTLIRECLLPAVAAALKSKARSARRGPTDTCLLDGYDSLKAVYEVDQSPIGRTPRSTPATYVGFFDEIRALFALTPEAKMRGYTRSRFSFNSAQGRCPECEGAGTIKLEMNFLPPAFVRCETCGGSRFNRETLDIHYAGKNVAQVLDLSVEEAIEFFRSVPKVLRPLQALHDTGLDYLKLGQTSPTLSGGEAQRVKLVTHLLSGLKEAPELFDFADPKQKRNLFILEEPTIGLHLADVRRLVEVIQRLVDAGHSVIVIEHNLDLIAEADWVIDLGPEGGEAGGRLVVAGIPEDVAKNKHSHTGRFLRQELRRMVKR